MQTPQQSLAVPSHPNAVELAALMDDTSLPSTQRRLFRRALFDVLCDHTHPGRQPKVKGAHPGQTRLDPGQATA